MNPNDEPARPNPTPATPVAPDNLADTALNNESAVGAPVQSHKPLSEWSEDLFDKPAQLSNLGYQNQSQPMRTKTTPPPPNVISNQTAELLLEDIAPDQPAATPVQQQPLSPQSPRRSNFLRRRNSGYQPNPIQNPYAPSSIPAKDYSTSQAPAPTITPQLPQVSANPAQAALPGQESTKKINPKIIAAIIAVLLLPVIVVAIILITRPADDNANEPAENAQSQTDNQRKNDLGVLLVAIKQYSQENNGKLLVISPQETRTFSEQYLPKEFYDPGTNESYQLITEVPTTGEFQYVSGAACSNDGRIVKGQPRQFAVRTLLEDGSFYCADD